MFYCGFNTPSLVAAVAMAHISTIFNTFYASSATFYYFLDVQSSRFGDPTGLDAYTQRALMQSSPLFSTSSGVKPWDPTNLEQVL